MRHNPTDYFAYKKNKIQLDIEPTRKPISRLNFLFQIFIATFIIFFDNSLGSCGTVIACISTIQ